MLATCILVVLFVGSLANPTRKPMKTAMPRCEQNESCVGEFCICCGECNLQNNCDVKADFDCSKVELLVGEERRPHKLTAEEKKAASDFFKTAMKYTNDSSWDWDKQNS